MTEGRGCDFAIEAAGKVETIEKAFSYQKERGQLCFASHPKVGETISIDPFELISGKKIMGSWEAGQIRTKISLYLTSFIVNEN